MDVPEPGYRLEDDLKLLRVSTCITDRDTRTPMTGDGKKGSGTMRS